MWNTSSESFPLILLKTRTAAVFEQQRHFSSTVSVQNLIVQLIFSFSLDATRKEKGSGVVLLFNDTLLCAPLPEISLSIAFFKTLEAFKVPGKKMLLSLTEPKINLIK
jgi:hypothetical protein